MKKYIAMLMSLMMIGCTFTACGDSNDSGDEKKTTASSKEKATDDEEVTSGEEDEDDTTEDDEEKTTENKGKNKLSKAYGKWQFEGNDKAYLDIEDAETAWIVANQDLSTDIYFDVDENFNFSDTSFSAGDYSFKEGKFVLDYEDRNFLTMEKTDGDTESIFGEYEWESGFVYDAFIGGFSNKTGGKAADVKLIMTCEENDTVLSSYIAVDGFKIDSETITMNSSIFGEGLEDISYEIEDDEFILHGENGKTKKMIRIE